MGPRLTKDDKEALSASFPDLNCDLETQEIWGSLHFSCSYESKDGQLIYNVVGTDFINDCYEILIDFKRHDDFLLPKVFETSGMIENYAAKRGIPTGEFHLFMDGSCCLGINPRYDWKSALHFIYQDVVPFFYWQSYFRSHGREPWETHAHNDEGLRNAMTRKVGFRKGRIRNQKCPCNSGMKYKVCCLRKDIDLHEIIQKSLLDEVVFKRVVEIKSFNENSALNGLLIPADCKQDRLPDDFSIQQLTIDEHEHES